MKRTREKESKREEGDGGRGETDFLSEKNNEKKTRLYAADNYAMIYGDSRAVAQILETIQLLTSVDWACGKNMCVIGTNSVLRHACAKIERELVYSDGERETVEASEKRQRLDSRFYRRGQKNQRLTCEIIQMYQ